MKARFGTRLGAAAAYAGLALAGGCATRPPPPPILVPVPVPCVTGDLPDEPRRIQSELSGDSGVDIGIIAGSAIELRAWGQALRLMLNACRAAAPRVVSPPPAPPVVSPPPASSVLSPPPDDPGTPQTDER